METTSTLAKCVDRGAAQSRHPLPFIFGPYDCEAGALAQDLEYRQDSIWDIKRKDQSFKNKENI